MSTMSRSLFVRVRVRVCVWNLRKFSLRRKKKKKKRSANAVVNNKIESIKLINQKLPENYYICRPKGTSQRDARKTMKNKDIFIRCQREWEKRRKEEKNGKKRFSSYFDSELRLNYAGDLCRKSNKFRFGTYRMPKKKITCTHTQYLTNSSLKPNNNNNNKNSNQIRAEHHIESMFVQNAKDTSEMHWTVLRWADILYRV